MEEPAEDPLSVDPDIDAVILGASRGDRSVLPALQRYLEEALALFSNSRAVGEATGAAVEGNSEAKTAAATQRLVAPMILIQDLIDAAGQLPDASLEPVLRELLQDIEYDGVLAALETIHPATPPVSTGELARLLRGGKQRGVKAAIKRASIGDLLAGLAESIAGDNEFTEDIANACHKAKEAEVLTAVQPWLSGADPCHRQAAAWALGREGDEDGLPDARTMECLYTLLADPVPEVVVAALHALGERTARNFTSSDLERMRQACENHPSVTVRGAYSDVFYSPYVGGDAASGALDVWLRMSRDEDARQRYLACGRLRNFLYEFNRNDSTDYGKISATLNAALADSSAAVRFDALGGLSDLGEDHDDQIEAELNALADLLERSGIEKRTGYEDDGLDLVGEMLSKPRRRFVPAMERIVKLSQEEEGDFLSSILENCRNAPPATGGEDS